MKCPYCQTETPVYNEGSLIQSYYCNKGVNCHVLWEIFTDGRPYRTYVYFKLPVKNVNRDLVFYIDHQTQTSQVYYHANKLTDKLFELSHVPNWTPSNLAQEVKKVLAFL